MYKLSEVISLPQELLRTIVLRTRRALDEDVFLPLYPKKYISLRLEDKVGLCSTFEGGLNVFFYVVCSVFDNKNGGPYLFYQRQFWSCVKVCVEHV